MSYVLDFLAGAAAGGFVVGLFGAKLKADILAELAKIKAKL